MNFSSVIGFLIISTFSQSPPVTGAVFQAQGELAGEVTSTNALLQTRLTASDILIDGDVPGARGFARFEWADNSQFRNSKKSDWLRSNAINDFIVRTEATSLKPATKYFYRVHFGRDIDTARTGSVRSFVSLGSETDVAPVRFVIANCMNYSFFHNGPKNDGKNAYSGADKHLGYPAAATILRLNPDFFIGAGDTVYYDHPREERAKSRGALRKKWHEQFVQPRLVSLFADVPTYWMKDDHDYRVNDSDPTGIYEPSHDLGIKVFREQLPVVPPNDPTATTYRTIRVGRDLQIWLVEGRDYRSPNKSKDGAQKSIWGTEQKEWLRRTLKESDATFKILVSPTPMVGPDDAYKTDNHTNIGGFRHEGDEFFTWLVENNFPTNRFHILCGDRHWKYHSIHPSGYSEFSCGALNRQNSRRGKNPGDAKSTDPDALIAQPYTDPDPLGGFLEISLDYTENGPGITFLLRDEAGAIRYSKAVR